MDKIKADVRFDERTLEVSLVVWCPGRREQGSEITMDVRTAELLHRQFGKAITAAKKHPAQPGAPRYAILHGGETLQLKKVAG